MQGGGIEPPLSHTIKEVSSIVRGVQEYHLHHTLLFYVSKTMELSVVCECHDINRFRIPDTASIDVPYDTPYIL